MGELLDSLFFIVKKRLKNEIRFDSCQKITTKNENSEKYIDNRLQRVYNG